MRNLVELEVKINSDNDAFVENPAAETARILRGVADSIDSTDYCQLSLYDSNGNRVGSFCFEVNEDG